MRVLVSVCREMSPSVSSAITFMCVYIRLCVCVSVPVCVCVCIDMPPWVSCHDRRVCVCVCVCMCVCTCTCVCVDMPSSASS